MMKPTMEIAVTLKRLKLSLLVAMATGMFVNPHRAYADTIIFSDIAAGVPQYSLAGAYSVQGNNNGINSRQQWYAMPFIPQAGYTMTEVDVGMTNFQGTASVQLALYANGANNLPGNMIQQFPAITNLPAGPRECDPQAACPIESIGGLTIGLTAGATYWLVAQNIAADSLDQWYYSSQLNAIGRVAQNFNGGGWGLTVNGQQATLAAFEVLGRPVEGAPEPASMLLGITGLAGILGCAWRKHKNSVEKNSVRLD
jgi:hypothetical protein